MKIAALTIVGLATITTLAGCTTEGRPHPLPGPPRACNADRAQHFVGLRDNAGLINKVRRQTGARTARRITPGSAVTMDYRMERVNVWIDARGRVEKITCG